MLKNPFLEPEGRFTGGSRVYRWSEIFGQFSNTKLDVTDLDLMTWLESKATDETERRNLAFTKLFAKQAKLAGGRVLIVGGYVRDLLLSLSGETHNSKDLDLEVYGLKPAQVIKLAQTVLADPQNRDLFSHDGIAGLETVGKAFGVIKIFDIDIAVARHDVRTAPGQGRQPVVTPEPDLDFAEAAFRRDLTVNALAMDPLAGLIYDAYRGLEDLKSKTLRHIYTGDNPTQTLFADDPLRVLRLMSFVGRLAFEIAPETRNLCLSIPLDALPRERIGEEWSKALVKSSKPSLSLKAGQLLRVYPKILPELDTLTGVAYDWSTTLESLDKIGDKRLGYNLKLILLHVILFNNRSQDSQSFLKRVALPGIDRDSFAKSIKLTLESLSDLVGLLANDNVVDRDFILRDTSYKLKNALYVDPDGKRCYVTLKDLLLVADALGLDPKRLKTLQARAKTLHVLETSPACILTGSEIISLGVPAGPKVGEMLQLIMDAQLHGKFDDKKHLLQKNLAHEFVKNRLNF